MADAQSDTLYLKKDDTQQWPVITVLANAVAQDLSTATAVVLYMRAVGSSTNKINGTAATIVGDGTAGQVTYTPVAADMDTAGVFRAYLRITWTGAKTSRWPNQGNVGTDNDFFRVEISSNFE
jgi:hypothetical protein